MSGQVLSRRILDLNESETIAMARLSRQLISEGHDVISLSLGEPDFNTPQYIREAAKNAIDLGYSHYPPVAGYADLRDSICKKLSRDNALSYNAGQIVVSTGAKQAIANACLSLLNPGDEVLIPAPYWVSYVQIVKLAEAIPVFIHSKLENDFKVSASDIEEKITARTRMLIYSSPCNPTGSVYTRDELESIAEMLGRHDHVFVVSDEIYEHIIFEGRHHSMAACEGMYERTAIINGVSKSHAMTGWRIGYLAGPDWLAAACDKMQGQFTSATCGIAQRAAKAAIESSPALIKEMRETFRKRRDLVLELLKDVPGLKLNKPCGAFYVFPDVSSYFGKKYKKHFIKDAEALCMFLLSEAKVSLVTGSAFGDPNCLRISYAASDEELREAMKRIRETLSLLSKF